jgi:hypothetical protein
MPMRENGNEFHFLPPSRKGHEEFRKGDDYRKKLHRSDMSVAMGATHGKKVTETSNV